MNAHGFNYKTFLNVKKQQLYSSLQLYVPDVQQFDFKLLNIIYIEMDWVGPSTALSHLLIFLWTLKGMFGKNKMVLRERLIKTTNFQSS